MWPLVSSLPSAGDVYCHLTVSLSVCSVFSMESTLTMTMCTSLLRPGVSRQSIHVGHDAPVGESGRAGPLRSTEWSDGCDSGGRRGGARRGEGRRVGRGHGRRRFGGGGGLGQEGGLLVGAGPGGEPDRRLRLDGVG